MSVTSEEQKNIERILADNFDRFINYANNTFVKKEEFERKFAHLDQEQRDIQIRLGIIEKTMVTKDELISGLSKLKIDLIIWMIGLILGNTALIFTILKTFLKV